MSRTSSRDSSWSNQRRDHRTLLSMGRNWYPKTKAAPHRKTMPPIQNPNCRSMFPMRMFPQDSRMPIRKVHPVWSASVVKYQVEGKFVVPAHAAAKTNASISIPAATDPPTGPRLHSFGNSRVKAHAISVSNKQEKNQSNLIDFVQMA